MGDELRPADKAKDDAASCVGASDASGAGNRVDWGDALNVAAGDVGLLLEVIEAFQTETPQMMSLIHDALETRDAKLLHRATHTVKNAFFSIGAKGTGTLAYELEKISKEASFEQVPPLLAQLDLHMQQIEKEVEQFIREQRAG